MNKVIINRVKIGKSKCLLFKQNRVYLSLYEFTRSRYRFKKMFELTRNTVKYDANSHNTPAIFYIFFNDG